MKDESIEERISRTKAKIEKLSQTKVVRDYLLLIDKLNTLESKYNSTCNHILTNIGEDLYYCPKCRIITNNKDLNNSSLISPIRTSIEEVDYLYKYYKNLGLKEEEISILMSKNIDTGKKYIKKRD